ncbi:MAG: hypothetical protein DRI57_04855 [Deltaproteobacteria bacterium]|nr:MAG: hypothetical protein DRI57_04855 [Deltaproteobacteria bacterium]
MPLQKIETIDDPASLNPHFFPRLFHKQRIRSMGQREYFTSANLPHSSRLHFPSFISQTEQPVNGVKRVFQGGKNSP